MISHNQIAAKYAAKIHSLYPELYCESDQVAELIRSAAAEMVKESEAIKGLEMAEKDLTRLFTKLTIHGPLPDPATMQQVSFSLTNLKVIADQTK